MQSTLEPVIMMNGETAICRERFDVHMSVRGVSLVLDCLAPNVPGFQMLLGMDAVRCAWRSV